MNGAQQLAMQIREWLSSKEQQPVSNLDTAERDAAAMHITMLETLAGIDPDDLATVTRGRVTCPEEHHAALREAIARPTPLEPGMIVPWRLVGNLECAVHWTTRAPVRQDAWSQDEWLLHAVEYRLMLTFLLSAHRHARTCGWRWRVIENAEVAAIDGARADQLLRMAVECPRTRLRLVFAPPDAQEQDCARRIRDTERGFQRLYEAKLQTRALLARVMQ